MTGLDTAIREAIDRADARDAAARERVYRSARRALESSLARRPELDRAMVDEQRQRFDELIREIEREKLAQEKAPGSAPAAPRSDAGEAADPLAEAPAVDDGDRAPAGDPGTTPPAAKAAAGLGPPGGGREAPQMAPAPLADVEPSGMPGSGDGRSAGMFDGLAAEVRAEHRPAKKQRERADRKERRRDGNERRRRPRAAARMMSALFLLVSFLVFGALALWFLSATGLVGDTVTAGGGASSFRKFDAVSNGGSPGLMTENSFGGAWSPIFAPGKGGTVSAGPAARVEKVTDERGKALRLTSTTTGPDGDLRIEVPAALMDRMAGRTSILALNVRGVGGKSTQIALECAFPSLGGCHRRRFTVSAEMTDVVMKLQFDKAAPPHKTGHLLLNTDIQGKGRSVDLFAVGLRGAN